VQSVPLRSLQREIRLVRNCGANGVASATFKSSAPQMLCPERCEYPACQLLSLQPMFLVCQDFLMVRFVSFARLIFSVAVGL